MTMVHHAERTIEADGSPSGRLIRSCDVDQRSSKRDYATSIRHQVNTTTSRHSLMTSSWRNLPLRGAIWEQHVYRTTHVVRTALLTLMRRRDITDSVDRPPSGCACVPVKAGPMFPVNCRFDLQTFRYSSINIHSLSPLAWQAWIVCRVLLCFAVNLWWGSLHRSPRRSSWIKGAYFKGREGRERERERREGRRTEGGRGGKGKEGRGKGPKGRKESGREREFGIHNF